MRRWVVLVAAISLLCTQILNGCSNAESVVEPDVPVGLDSYVDDSDTFADATDTYVYETEVTDTDTDIDTPENVSRFAEYDMLEITIDEIPFTLGDSLSDFISNLNIISYRISANVKNRNLSAGQSLEIPIVAEDNRTVGFLTITNNDRKKHSMKTSPVTSITIIPDAVFSVSAFEINQDSTYEDTTFVLGDAYNSELTSLLYESDIGKLYFTYTANGVLTGITVQRKEVL